MTRGYRILVICLFALLAVLSVVQVSQLRFTFDFEQFFPEGDEDLEFFKTFIEQFEADDNFLLVAVRRPEGVFDSTFLHQFHDLTIGSRSLPGVTHAQSLTKFEYPLKTPFGITTLPQTTLHTPHHYSAEKKRILQDKRLVHNFITADATTLVLYLKTTNSQQLEEARALMGGLEELISGFAFSEYHILGRAFFQREMVDMQQRELFVSATVSSLLVTLVMFLMYRRLRGILIALASIGLGMLLFLGFLGILGRELNAMSALYPVIMIIVGTSDVIHIMSKYIDELRKGKSRDEAIGITIREIGLATLLTSITTAIGFATLITSRIQPIRDFGINAAVGVMVAYLTVIFFTTALLSLFEAEQLTRAGKGKEFWEKAMRRSYYFTLNYPGTIAWSGLALLLISLFGISLVSTNYDIKNNLPRGKKITEDFQFFENNLTGFRPLEIAVFAGEGRMADDFEVLGEMQKVEDHLEQFPFVQGSASITALYKSINMMYSNNRPEAYELPARKESLDAYSKLAKQVPRLNLDVLLSRDNRKARISSRILDIGADSLQAFGDDLDTWIASNTNPDIATFRQTGTGMIINKNSEYVRGSLLKGLGLAVAIVSLLMALLFQNARMLIISLIPNIFPLLLAGALLGYLGIELEAGLAIVFAVIFGIAVDDTIHFLSKYKLSLRSGKRREEALYITFMETGKAISLTTIILFFGFLVMLFSIHPPSVTIGLIISLTLTSAVVCDLLFIPVLIRRLLPGAPEAREKGE